MIVEDGAVLLNQHGDATFGKFCGGRVEDESVDLLENARREVKEEMGIAIEVLDPNPFIMYTTKETAEGLIDVILVHYLAKRVGEIHPGRDIRVWQWLPLDRLPENCAPNILPALRYFKFLS